MKLKKVFALFLALFLIGSFAVGCGKPAANTNESSANASESSVNTDNQDSKAAPSAGKGSAHLKVAISSGEVSGTEGTAPLKKMMEPFEKENNCTVDLVVIAHDGWADYLTKLQTMMVSGNGPDVFQNPHEGGRMANALKLSAPLDDYIAKHKDQWDDFTKNTPDSLEGARVVDGKIYGLPYCYQTTVMWLNTDRLKAAGLPVPDVNWKWDEFQDYLDVLSKPTTDGKKQYAWAIPDYYFVYNQWLYTFGTGFLNDKYDQVTFDSPNSIELMQFCADAVKKGIAPMPDKNYDYLQQLVDGHVAMTTAGRWMVNYCNSNDFYNVACVHVPQKYSDRQEYAVGNVEVCSSTSNYDLAAAFCFYTVSETWITDWANNTANIPSRYGIKLTDKATVKGYTNQNLFDDLPNGSYPMQSPAAFTEISNIFDRTFSSVISGETTAEKGCKAAAEEMRAALAANPG